MQVEGCSLKKISKEAAFAVTRKQTSVMKTLIRVMALVLACLFCLTVVISCGKKDTTTNSGTNKGGSNTATDTDEEEYHVDEKTGKMVDAWGKQKDELPDDLDFNKATVNILTWSDVEKPDFEVEEESEDERMEAIYRRNNAIQRRLNVKLEFDGVRGDSGNMSGFVNHVETTQQAGTHDFDLIATYSRTAGTLTVKGMMVDVNRIEDTYLTISTPVHPREEENRNPWWPKYLSENMQMGNKLYLLSGDISITVLDELHCIYFNKELVNIQFEEQALDEGAESGSRLLYKYVREGKWTIDKMIEMSSNYWVDSNTTGVADYGDKFGMCSIDYCATAIYGSCNFKMLEPDPQKILIRSEDVTSQRLHQLVTKVGDFMTSNDYFHNSRGQYYVQPFIDGEALFMLHYLESAEDHLIGNDRVEEYGVVPCPKYNELQRNYYTVIGNAFTVFGIFRGYDKHGNEAGTLSMLSAVLECWASEGYRKCTPVVFELNMQLKYSQTQDETDMCEYIRAGIMFDLGRIMESAFGDYRIDSQFIKACEAGTAWSSQLDKILTPAEASLAQFLSELSVDFNS